MHKGSCQCGAVSFEVDGELGAPDACHCSICRKLSGHYYVGTEVSKDTLTVDAKSIMSVMRLAATKGTKLTIVSDGDDAEEAVDALVQLISGGFGEFEQGES